MGEPIILHMSEFIAWAVTAAAITPDTPRYALRNPGIDVSDSNSDTVAWHSLPTGWEISLADGTLDAAAANAVLAEMGWTLEPGCRWHATAMPGQYITGVVRTDDSQPDKPVVHEKCGFPVIPDEGGNWHHADPLDDTYCELLFSGGSMLDALLDQEPEN